MVGKQKKPISRLAQRANRLTSGNVTLKLILFDPNFLMFQLVQIHQSSAEIDHQRAEEIHCPSLPLTFFSEGIRSKSTARRWKLAFVARSRFHAIILQIQMLPSGKRLHNYGKSPFLMGKSTISMAIFNS
jgi:hypothetical protein